MNGVVLKVVAIRVGASAIFAALVCLVGCSTTSLSSAVALVGFCADTCPNKCLSDSDCGPVVDGGITWQTSCCDLGSGKQVCVSSCPKSCAGDSECNTSIGQACVRTSLATTQTYCAPVHNAIKACSNDAQCASVTGDICCAIYKTPICLPSSSCPKACRRTSDCDIGLEQVCCPFGANDTELTVPGLCVESAACPASCKTDADCAAAANAAAVTNVSSTSRLVCCNGTCASSCQHVCRQTSDCNQQICCKLPAAPVAQMSMYAAPRICSGTPAANSCALCPGCDCPGCTPGPDSCQGTPSWATCADCGASCAQCVGCSYAECSGTSYATCVECANAGFACADCYGCYVDLSSSACTGTTFSCALLGANGCLKEPGCVRPVGNCTGTLAACAQLTAAMTCSAQPGCTWALSSCSGAPTPCNGLTPSDCYRQAGCQFK